MSQVSPRKKVNSILSCVLLVCMSAGSLFKGVEAWFKALTPVSTATTLNIWPLDFWRYWALVLTYYVHDKNHVVNWLSGASETQFWRCWGSVLTYYVHGVKIWDMVTWYFYSSPSSSWLAACQLGAQIINHSLFLSNCWVRYAAKIHMCATLHTFLLLTCTVA